nr:hypothetical protein [Tanacetum cinerariifolium]
IDDSHVTLTLIHSDGQESSSTSSFVTSLLNPIIDPDRVKSLEVNFSEFMRTNQSPEAISNIPAILKRRREEDSDQKGPSAGSDRGSKDEEKEGSMHQLAFYLNQLPGVQAGLLQGLNLDSCLPMKEPSYLVFETGVEDQPIVQISQHPEWFSQPRRPPTP